MGMYGGALTGLRAAREDQLRERAQAEAERKAQADEQFRTEQAEQAQANTDRQFQAGREDAATAQANADREFGIKQSDLTLRQERDQLDAAIKQEDFAARKEDRQFNRDIKQMEVDAAREERALRREKMGIDADLARENIKGAKEERALRSRLGELTAEGKRSEIDLGKAREARLAAADTADRQFRAEQAKIEQAFKNKELTFRERDVALREAEAKHKQSLEEADRTFREKEAQRNQGNIEADRTFRQSEAARAQGNEERRLTMAEEQNGLQLEKGRVESQILGEQLAELKRKREERAKERELFGKSNMMGLGLVMDSILQAPTNAQGIRTIDPDDLAEIVKMYPQFANVEGRGALMGGACVINPETGRVEMKLLYGDGKEVKSQTSFDEASIMRGLRSAGYGEDSVNTQLNLIRPEPTFAKLKKLTAQEQAKQAEIRITNEERQNRQHEHRTLENREKEELKQLGTQILYYESKIDNLDKEDEGYEDKLRLYTDRLEAAREAKRKLIGGGATTPESSPAQVDPLADKWGKYKVNK